jgi:parallel beta-helix repeat protein
MGILVGVLLISVALPVIADVDVSGNVEGTWQQAASPYIVVGSLRLADGDTLRIEPGVDVQFSGHYGFDVSGVLLAVGEDEDSIRFFSPGGQPDDWISIKFTGAHTSGSRLTCCIIADANRGVETDGSNLVISESRFSQHLDAGLRIAGGQPTISGCVVSDVSAGGSSAGIKLVESSRAVVRNCLVLQCGNYGIAVASSAAPTITDNYIIQSGDQSIYLKDAGNCIIRGNVILNGSLEGIHIETSGSQVVERNVVYRSSGVGLWIYRSGETNFINNTVYESGNKGIQIYATEGQVINNLVARSNAEGIFAQNSNPLTLHNDSWGNSGDDYSGVNIDSSDLSVDPLLAAPADGDFHPTAESPLVDAGMVPYNDPDGTIADIGAWFFNQNHPPVITDWSPQSLDSLVGGGEVEFSVAASDSDRHQLWYHWFVNDREKIGAGDHFTYNFQVDGHYVVKVVVDDRWYLGTTEHLWQFDVRGAAVPPDGRLEPVSFALSEPYPNPFNSTTRVWLQTATPGNVAVTVYDLHGRLVAGLLDAPLQPGEYPLVFSGNGLSAGCYILSAQSSSAQVHRKLFYIR